MKTKLISMLLIAVMLISSVCTVFASDVISVFVDGKQVEFDVHPVSENGRTLVPMRYIFEALGADVQWHQEENKAIATKGSITIEITLNDNIMIRSGKEITLDVPAKAINGRTLVPARAIAEALDAKVVWDPDEYSVIITSPEKLEASTSNPEEAEARKVAKAYIEAVATLDIQKAAKLSVNGDELSADITEGNFTDYIIDTVIEEIQNAEGSTSVLTGTDETMSEYLRVLLEGGFDAFIKNITYDIDSVQEENGEYIYTVNITMPDSVYVESAIANSFDEEKINAISQEIVAELAASGKITPTLTEEELMALMMVPMAEKMVPVMADAISACKTSTTTETVTVVNKDGKWLVAEGEFGVDDIDFSSILGSINQ